MVLSSTSRSADAGHLAAADIVKVAEDASTDFRLIGGNAINLIVLGSHADGLVPARETIDADLGVPSAATGAAGLVEALVGNGYRQSRGNHFTRTVRHDRDQLTLEIDVRTRSYSDRMQSNQPFGDLVVEAVPGLALAMARPPELVRVTATLTNGARLFYTIPLPDPISALCMKAYAYRWRFAARDAMDVWRLLEVIRLRGLTKQDWPKGVSGRETAGILHTHFGVPSAGGPKAATPHGATQARIRALVLAIVPRPTR